MTLKQEAIALIEDAESLIHDEEKINTANLKARMDARRRDHNAGLRCQRTPFSLLLSFGRAKESRSYNA